MARSLRPAPAGELLLVDDEPMASRLLQAILEPLGLPITSVGTGAAALARIEREAVRLVVLDLVLPDTSGLDVLERALAHRRDLPVIMLTAASDVSTAVRALQLGAANYLTKPVNHDELLLSVRRALERALLLGEVHALRDEVHGAFLVAQMGPSEKVGELVQKVSEVGDSPMSVLVLGETGSGKELVARALHRASRRRDAPFVAVDCGALPEALFESELFGHEEGAFTGARRKQRGQIVLAEGGTIFLDEIGNLSIANQAKLLRVLEDRAVRPLGAAQSQPVDVRVVAATNEQLGARVAAGEFRQDLYYRLAEYVIELPALRERRADIVPLAQRFRREASEELGRAVLSFDDAALLQLERHDWPGNVRELRNAVRRAVLACPGTTIRTEHFSALPPPAAAPEAAPRTLGGRSLKQIADEASAAAERWAIGEALAVSHGSQAEAARLLRIDAKTMYRKMVRFGIKRGG